jgi:hypothetical protein
MPNYDNTAPDEISPPDQWVNIRAGGTLSGTVPTDVAPGTSFQGVTLAQGDSFFAVLALQSTTGIYLVGASASTRRSDANAGSEFRPGRFLRVKEGTNAGKVWFCTNQTTPTVGVSSLTFEEAAPSTVTVPGSSFDNSDVDLAEEPSGAAGFDSTGPGTRSTATHIPSFDNSDVDLAEEPE